MTSAAKSTKKDRKPLEFPAGFNADRIMRYQYTSLDGNSNKWYDYHIKDNADSLGRIWVVSRYGRVGDQGMQHDYGLIYRSELGTMIYERTRAEPRGKGYAPVELHSVTTTSSGRVDTSTPEGALAEIIIVEAGESIKGFLATTVDKLSQNQINEARAKLSNIRTLSTSRFGGLSDAYALSKMVESYYRLIPTVLPRRIDPTKIVTDFLKAEALDEQELRLQQLEGAIASMVATDSVGTSGSIDALLGATVKRLPPNTLEARSILDFVTTTGGNRVRNAAVYSVLIPSERAAFKGRSVAQGPTRLLFHGTRNKYVRHILRKGLIVPPHQPNGRSLGNGIYFSDKFQKSRNYVQASYGNPSMVFVSEVALGRIHVGNTHGPVRGYDSVHSPAGYWPYCEYCVYTPSQATIRYLVTFDD